LRGDCGERDVWINRIQGTHLAPELAPPVAATSIIGVSQPSPKNPFTKGSDGGSTVELCYETALMHPIICPQKRKQLWIGMRKQLRNPLEIW
jgi:hypothetical protein